MKFSKEELIKSPLNYTGGKYKLLPQILPLFPDNIDTFVDLFCGGGNVGVNVKANKIICNDVQTEVINILNEFKENDLYDIEDKIKNIINIYGLNKENKNGYINLRKSYNETKDDYEFITLLFHSFNNQIRFNKKGEFNLPFGGRTFNKNIQNNLVEFVDKIHTTNISFKNCDFREIDLNKLYSKDMVYCDPPYALAFKEYNGIHYWTNKEDTDLLNMLDNLNEKGVRFALSNVFETKGKINDSLINWSRKYKVHYINANYNNCNYIKNTKGNDIEVLITNY